MVWGRAPNRRLALARTDALFGTRELGAATLLGLVVSAGAGVLAASGSRAASLCLVGVTGIAVLAVVPVRALPSLALGVTVLVPTDALPLPSGLAGAPLGIVPLAVFLVRADRTAMTSQRERFATIVAVALTAWFLLSMIFASHQTLKGLSWLLAFVVCIPATVVSRRAISDDGTFESFFLWLIAALGAFAILEAFVFHANPIYGRFYEQLPWVHQHWTTYRAETLMGHPLFNGTVFAAAAPIATAAILRDTRRSVPGLCQLILIGGGLAATYSRSGMVAAAIGVLLAIVLQQRSQRAALIRRLAIAMVIAAGAVVLSASFLARNASSEGRASAQGRASVMRETSTLMRYTTPLGAGPGQAEQLRTSLRVGNQHFRLENAYAQLIVAVGIVGTALVVLLLGLAAAELLSMPSGTGFGCAVIATMISITAYNASEGHLAVWVLLGLLILAGRGAGKPRAGAPAPALGAT